MSVSTEQGQALENALNTIRNAVHDSVVKLPAVIQFAEQIADGGVDVTTSAPGEELLTLEAAKQVLIDQGWSQPR